ncbi:MAG: SGNH/GDSL hydrolase family protein [Pirellulales bacterium]|nr:SGNH/GDSL hydrolase family protein [Pirellulales bacterium]
MSPVTPRLDRRDLMKSSLALAAAGAATASGSALAESTTEMSLAKGSVILFQGDSITDAGRNRKDKGANHPRGFGSGYAMLIAGALLRDHPSVGLKIYNRGISGNKVPDLDARWQEDCLDLRPQVLSILIGVNDIWHKLNGRYDGTVEVYQSGLEALLERTQQALPETRIVICEPFVLRCGAVNDSWFPEFEHRRAACEKVAQSMSLTYVPFQKMFDEAIKNAPPAYWAGDGVHPTMAGHALMAQRWREVVGL